MSEFIAGLALATFFYLPAIVFIFIRYQNLLKEKSMSSLWVNFRNSFTANLAPIVADLEGLLAQYIIQSAVAGAHKLAADHIASIVPPAPAVSEVDQSPGNG